MKYVSKDMNSQNTHPLSNQLGYFAYCSGAERIGLAYNTAAPRAANYEKKLLDILQKSQRVKPLHKYFTKIFLGSSSSQNSFYFFGNIVPNLFSIKAIVTLAYQLKLRQPSFSNDVILQPMILKKIVNQEKENSFHCRL